MNGLLVITRNKSISRGVSEVSSNLVKGQNGGLAVVPVGNSSPTSSRVNGSIVQQRNSSTFISANNPPHNRIPRQIISTNLINHDSHSLLTRLSQQGYQIQSHRSFSSDNNSVSSSSPPNFNNFDSNSITYLRDPKSGAEVYLIGTAHISDKSAKDVEELIKLVKPDFVFLELCNEREKKLRQIIDREDGKNVNKGGVGGMMEDFLLSLGVLPGSLGGGGVGGGKGSSGQQGGEFKAAIRIAERLNIPIVSGDRSQRETMSLLRGAMFRTSWWRVLTTQPPENVRKIFGRDGPGGIGMRGSSQEMQQKIEMIKDREGIRELQQYMNDLMPEIQDVMVDSRDKFMSEGLEKELEKRRGSSSGGVGSGGSSSGGVKVVAVVGMAHMDGIERQLFK